MPTLKELAAEYEAKRRREGDPNNAEPEMQAAGDRLRALGLGELPGVLGPDPTVAGVAGAMGARDMTGSPLSPGQERFTESYGPPRSPTQANGPELAPIGPPQRPFGPPRPPPLMEPAGPMLGSVEPPPQTPPLARWSRGPAPPGEQPDRYSEDDPEAARALATLRGGGVKVPYGPPPPVAPEIQKRAMQRLAGGGGGLKLPYPDAIPDLMKRFDEEAQAETDKVRAEQAGNAEIADLIDAQRAEAEGRMIGREAMRADRDRMIDAELGKAKQLTEKARGITFDSGRVFKNPGGVLMAMGAAFSKEGGGDILERALDRDWGEQLKNAEQRGKDAEGQWTLVGQFRAAYADRRVADLGAEIAYKDIAAEQMKALATRLQNPVILANAEKAIAQIYSRRDLLQQQMNAAVAKAAQEAAAAAERRAQQAFENGMKVFGAQTERMKAQGEAGDKIGVETRFLADKVAPLDETKQAVRRVEAELPKANWFNTNPASTEFSKEHPFLYRLLAGDDASSWQQANREFEGILLRARSGGAVSDGEAARFAAAIEGAGTLAAKKRAIANVLAEIDAKTASYKAGVSPRARAQYEGAQEGMAPLNKMPGSFTPGVP